MMILMVCFFNGGWFGLSGLYYFIFIWYFFVVIFFICRIIIVLKIYDFFCFIFIGGLLYFYIIVLIMGYGVLEILLIWRNIWFGNGGGGIWGGGIFCLIFFDFEIGLFVEGLYV